MALEAAGLVPDDRLAEFLDFLMPDNVEPDCPSDDSGIDDDPGANTAAGDRRSSARPTDDAPSHRRATTAPRPVLSDSRDLDDGTAHDLCDVPLSDADVSALVAVSQAITSPDYSPPQPVTDPSCAPTGPTSSPTPLCDVAPAVHPTPCGDTPSDQPQPLPVVDVSTATHAPVSPRADATAPDVLPLPPTVAAPPADDLSPPPPPPECHFTRLRIRTVELHRWPRTVLCIQDMPDPAAAVAMPSDDLPRPLKVIGKLYHPWSTTYQMQCRLPGHPRHCKLFIESSWYSAVGRSNDITHLHLCVCIFSLAGHSCA
jgi:hypothetical protein